MKCIMLAAVFMFLATGICLAAEQQELIGTYISKSDSKDYLSLSADGSFYLKQHRSPPNPDNPLMEVSGKYEKKDDKLTLKLSDGGEATCTIKGQTIEDAKGTVWVKEGSEVNKVEHPKRLKWYQ